MSVVKLASRGSLPKLHHSVFTTDTAEVEFFHIKQLSIPLSSLTWSRVCTSLWRKRCRRSSLRGRAHTPCPCWAALSERPTDKRTRDRRGHLEIGQEGPPGSAPGGLRPRSTRQQPVQGQDAEARPDSGPALGPRPLPSELLSQAPSFVSRPGSCYLSPFSQVHSLLSPSPGVSTETGSPLTTLKGNFLPWHLLISNLTS